MKTVKEYVFRLSSPKGNNDLINEKAIENGHTDSGDIYAKEFDISYTDSEGNRVTSGYRLTNDRKNRVLITIVNSYEKDAKNSELKNLNINND